MHRPSHSMPPVLAHLMATALLVLTAAACGDDTTSDEATVETTFATVTTPRTTPAPTTTRAVVQTFDVYLLVGPEDCSEVVPRPRTSTADNLVVGALTQLLAGPTAAETAEGLSSWFSSATEGMLREVVIEDRVAHVAFDTALRSTIPNASSSCGSAGFMAQLDATVTQFGTVAAAVYSLDGDVAAFYEWLQAAPPTT